MSKTKILVCSVFAVVGSHACTFEADASPSAGGEAAQTIIGAQSKSHIDEELKKLL